MSEKYLVVQGALCKCSYGTAPDKLKVLSHQKEYANDSSGSKKLLASTKDIGPATFEANMFGTCAKMNNNPCKAVVQEWKGYYDKITLTHKGKVLTEDSKAICPVGGNACIEVVWHGQTVAAGASGLAKTDKRAHAALNPLINTEEIQDELDETPDYF